MSYTTHELRQGTPEWLSYRANCCNASDAGTVLGLNPYKTRGDLIREMATGITAEIDTNTQRRFDDGHRFERLAIPIAETIIGEPLSPTTVSIAIPGLRRRLSASLDGSTFSDTENVEHKTLSDALAAALDRGELPEQYPPQMEQGMAITGATRCLFIASKWDDNYQLIAEKHVWYESDPALRAKIIAAWKQAEADADSYQHVEVIPAAVAAPIKDLPAVVLTASGSLTIATNFEVWGVELRNFIARIPAKPATDQEFADCRAALTAFKKAEAQLDSEEARVLSMVPDIDSMKREKKLLFDLSRTTRLALEKLVEQRDIEVKTEITQEGKDAITAHIANLNKRISPVQMPQIVANFAEAIKGKRNLENMRGAVSDLVAAKKIESNEIADKIDANLKTLNASGHEHLFRDYAALAMKAPDDLALVIKTRIEDEERRQREETERILDAERAKIRAEEEAKAAAKVKAEQEAAALAAKQNTAPAVVGNTEPDANVPASNDGIGETPAPGQRETPQDTGRMMKLGEISEAIGVGVTSEFLGRLGFQAKQEKNARLYRECDFQRICSAIARHCEEVAITYGKLAARSRQAKRQS